MLDFFAVQSALRAQGLDGWLLYDFRGLNILARRVLGFPPTAHSTRRWFYFIPTEGEPLKLVHRIEPHALDCAPGQASTYLRWQELEQGVKALLGKAKRVAMEYVPRNANPVLSRVDAGTVDLIRGFGVDVVSSGDLIQLFESCWDDTQWTMHLEAAVHTRSTFDSAFAYIIEKIRSDGSVRETEVQRHILEHFARHGLVTDHPPIVAVGAHSGDPHYAPQAGSDALIRAGDFVLIDLWAKLDKPRSVYSDLTWTCFVGETVPEQYERIFRLVAAARDAAIALVRTAFSTNTELRGWEVDQAARSVIDASGYGEAFCHRTGHSIGEETHGNGANMDGLETREERRLIPRTCFSIEPGIYLPDFGIRSEVNVYIDADSRVHVTGGAPQSAIVPLLAEHLREGVDRP